MKALRIVIRFGLLIGFGIAIPGLPTTAQTTSPKEAQLPAPGLRKLTGDDAKQAEELDKAIEAALKADRWDEAIARAEELLALRTLAQGPKHFETVDVEWRPQGIAPHGPDVEGRSSDLPIDSKPWMSKQQPFTPRAKTLRLSRFTRRHSRSAADCSPTTTSTPPIATTTWRQISTSRDGTPRHSRSTKRRWKSSRRLLTENDLGTANSYNNLALNLERTGEVR